MAYFGPRRRRLTTVERAPDNAMFESTSLRDPYVGFLVAAFLGCGLFVLLFIGAYNPAAVGGFSGIAFGLAVDRAVDAFRCHLRQRKESRTFWLDRRGSVTRFNRPITIYVNETHR